MSLTPIAPFGFRYSNFQIVGHHFAPTPNATPRWNRMADGLPVSYDRVEGMFASTSRKEMDYLQN